MPLSYHRINFFIHWQRICWIEGIDVRRAPSERPQMSEFTQIIVNRVAKSLLVYFEWIVKRVVKILGSNKSIILHEVVHDIVILSYHSPSEIDIPLKVWGLSIRARPRRLALLVLAKFSAWMHNRLSIYFIWVAFTLGFQTIVGASSVIVQKVLYIRARSLSPRHFSPLKGNKCDCSNRLQAGQRKEASRTFTCNKIIRLPRILIDHVRWVTLMEWQYLLNLWT